MPSSNARESSNGFRSVEPRLLGLSCLACAIGHDESPTKISTADDDAREPDIDAPHQAAAVPF